MPVIDTHVHLYDVAEPLEVLKDSYQNGVSEVLLLGVDGPSNQFHWDLYQQVQKTPQDFPKLHLAFGIHPYYIRTEKDYQKTMDWISSHREFMIAIGESGLDYAYDHVKNDLSAQEEQRKVFQQQIDLAVKFDLPIIVHSRQACADCFDLLQKSKIQKAHFHWYMGSLEVLKKIIQEGWTVSFSVALEYRPALQEMAVQIPLEHILIETDTPVPYPVEGESPKSKRVPSTPKDVFRTLKILAALKQKPIEEVLTVVNANAHQLFGEHCC